MLGLRENDFKPGTWYRADRVSMVNGQFYFATREGTLEGPYRTRESAAQAIDQYVNWVSGKRFCRFFKVSEL